MVIAVTAAGQTKELAATVTYVAAGQVYVDAGRLAGIIDSSAAVVRRNGHPITILRLIAASSRSSSWSADSSVASVRVGDTVTIRTPHVEAPELPRVDTVAAPAPVTILQTDYRRPARASGSATIEMVGRAGPQLMIIATDDASQGLVQAGVTLSMRLRSRDLPLRLDLYANARDLSRGSAKPLSARSSNASRLYRAALEYDDGVNVATLGRQTLPLAPTVGLLDGLMFARRWGEITAGVGVGIQPNPDLQFTDFNRRRFIVSAAYQSAAWLGANVAGTYAKTWYLGASEREVVNATGGAAITERLSVWGTSDVDLRMTRDGAHQLRPSLSLLLLTASWRVTDALSLTGGMDASRSVLPYSFARLIPDSMTDRSLRSGVTATGSMLLPYRMSLSVNVTPRMVAGAFNGDYAGSTSLSAYDLFGSGVGVRVQGSLNRGQMSSGQGYALHVSIHAWTVDWNVRAQQVRYRLRSVSTSIIGTTLGLDAIVPILPRLSWLASVDLVRGFGSASRTFYSELSWRF